jgi:Tol biopolymer transport system component
MNHRSLFLPAILACILLPNLGCTQFYNGSLGLKSEDRKAVADYDRLKQQHQAQLPPANPDPAFQSTPAVAFDHPAFPNADQNNAPLTYTTNMANKSVGALGLYGQLPQQNPSQTSPLDGTGNVRRVTFTTEGADFDPDIDPTGSLLVYASTSHRESSDIYLKRVDGSAVTQLTNDPANEIMPVFSPDGKRIAFASDRAGNFDIYVMDVAGGRAVQITDQTTDDLHPSFSPDGTRLVYCSIGSPSGQWEMIVVDLANPATKKVIGHGLFPTWSPTDDTILFQRARQRGTRWFSVWTTKLLDGEPTSPTEIAVSTNAAVITPDWSPDGQFVVFCTVIDPAADDHSRPQRADLWIVGADGSGRVKLTAGQYASLLPTWATDGSIYFVSNRGEDAMENIWALKPGAALQLAQPLETPAAAAPTD